MLLNKAQRMSFWRYIGIKSSNIEADIKKTTSSTASSIKGNNDNKYSSPKKIRKLIALKLWSELWKIQMQRFSDSPSSSSSASSSYFWLSAMTVFGAWICVWVCLAVYLKPINVFFQIFHFTYCGDHMQWMQRWQFQMFTVSKRRRLRRHRNMQ